MLWKYNIICQTISESIFKTMLNPTEFSHRNRNKVQFINYKYILLKIHKNQTENIKIDVYFVMIVHIDILMIKTFCGGAINVIEFPLESK